MGEPAADSDPDLSSELREGALVGGRYVLGVPIASGAMGRVWSATHAALGHGVAIKLLHPGGAVSPDACARFEREARLAARLGETCRHVARVLDYGHLEDGTPFLVMELLRGEELAARLRREGRLPLDVCARIVRQLCRALSAAHAAGVVHRDVKPSNVFLCEGDSDGGPLVKLMDFGVAKAARESARDEATRVGTVIGTPSYMSPEQVLASPVIDARADLWGVVATVYRMAVGQTPFGQGGFGELGVRILSASPVRPSAVDPSSPRAFDAFIDKGLAKDPEARFQSAEALADALALVAGVAFDDADPMPLRRALKEAPTLSPCTESVGAIKVGVPTPGPRGGGDSGVRRRRPTALRRGLGAGRVLGLVLVASLLSLGVTGPLLHVGRVSWQAGSRGQPLASMPPLLVAASSSEPSSTPSALSNAPSAPSPADAPSVGARATASASAIAPRRLLRPPR